MQLLAVVSKGNVQVAAMQYDGRTLTDAKALDSKFQESRSGTSSPAAPSVEREKLTERTAKASEQQQKQQTPILLSMQLPPEADGELDVTLYDQSVQPPKAVFYQQVQRGSSRGLNIDIAQQPVASALQAEAAAFVPRQELRLKLTATDQSGKEVPHSWFAARIVKADAVSAQSAVPTTRYAEADRSPTAGGSGGFKSIAPGGFGEGDKGREPKDGDAKDGQKDEAEKKEGLEGDAVAKEAKLKKAQNASAKADALAAGPPLPAPAGPAAEDRAAAGELGSPLTFSDEPLPGKPVVPQEVLLASNDSLVQDAVRAEQAAAAAATMDFRKLVGQVVLVVAAAALLLFGVLAILHRPAQAKVWVPAMAVVAGSFAVGSVWLMNGKFAAQKAPAVADARTSQQQDYFSYKHKPTAESAPTADTPSAKTENRNFAPLPEGALEKFSGGSGGIGPTVELPANGPVPGAESPPASAAPKPGVAGGGAGFGGGRGAPPGGGGRRTIGEKPLTEGKPGEAPAPAPKPEGAAEPGESARPKRSRIRSGPSMRFTVQFTNSPTRPEYSL